MLKYVDPDVKAHKKPSCQDLHCLLLLFFEFCQKSVFAVVNMSKLKDRRDFFRNSGRKGQGSILYKRIYKNHFYKNITDIFTDTSGMTTFQLDILQIMTNINIKSTKI